MLIVIKLIVINLYDFYKRYDPDYKLSCSTLLRGQFFRTQFTSITSISTKTDQNNTKQYQIVQSRSELRH